MAQLLFFGTLTIALGPGQLQKEMHGGQLFNAVGNREAATTMPPPDLRFMYSRAAFGPNATQEF